MNGKFVVIVLGALTCVVLTAGVIAAAFQYTRYLGLNERLPENHVPITVAITSPATGTQSPAGTALPVSVRATGASPLVSLELWANGALVGVQAGPAQGTSPLDGMFAWIPSTAGDYTLIARAIDAKKQNVPSLPLAVTIRATAKPGAEGERTTRKTGHEKGLLIANGIDASSGTDDPPEDAPIPSAILLPPPPLPPGPEESEGAAQPFQPNLGDFLTQPFVGDLPPPPALVGKATGCSVRLDIQDNSNNEEGFFIYRQSPSVPDWERIATLKGQSASKWLSYSDNAPLGAVSYYVASFNARGEAPGNIVSVNVKGVDCPLVSEVPAFSLALNGLKFNGPGDNAYCYRSFDNEHWSRLPVVGFFPKNADGFDTQGLVETILLKGQENKKLNLSLECWAWVGDSLKSIGKLHQDGIDVQKLGALSLKGEGLSTAINLGSGLAKPMDSTTGNPPFMWLSDSLMPVLSVHLGYGVDNCKKMLPSQGQDGVEAWLFCSLYPSAYTAAKQPFLYWDVMEGVCANDSDHSGAPPCRTLQWYKDRAAQYGGKLRYRARYEYQADWKSAAWTNVDIGLVPLKEKTLAIPPLNICSNWDPLVSKTVYYQVMLSYAAGPNDPDYANQELVDDVYTDRIPFDFKCPGAAPAEVTLGIDINSLKLANVDDDDGDDPQDVELYGYFMANSWDFNNSFPYDRVLIAPEEFPDGCADETIQWPGTLHTFGISECRPSLTNGTYDLKNLTLCSTLLVKQAGSKVTKSTSEKDCYLEDFSTDQNHLRVTVRDGDVLVLMSNLIDYDSASADDAVCVGTITLGPYTALEWASKFRHGVNKTLVQSDNGSASCKVKWKIKSFAP